MQSRTFESNAALLGAINRSVKTSSSHREDWPGKISINSIHCLLKHRIQPIRKTAKQERITNSIPRETTVKIEFGPVSSKDTSNVPKITIKKAMSSLVQLVQKQKLLELQMQKMEIFSKLSRTRPSTVAPPARLGTSGSLQAFKCISSIMSIHERYIELVATAPSSPKSRPSTSPLPFNGYT